MLRLGNRRIAGVRLLPKIPLSSCHHFAQIVTFAQICGLRSFLLRIFMGRQAVG